MNERAYLLKRSFKTISTPKRRSSNQKQTKNFCTKEYALSLIYSAIGNSLLISENRIPVERELLERMPSNTFVLLVIQSCDDNVLIDTSVGPYKNTDMITIEMVRRPTALDWLQSSQLWGSCMVGNISRSQLSRKSVPTIQPFAIASHKLLEWSYVHLTTCCTKAQYRCLLSTIAPRDPEAGEDMVRCSPIVDLSDLLQGQRSNPSII